MFVFDHVHIVSLSVLIVTHDRSRTRLSFPCLSMLQLVAAAATRSVGGCPRAA